MLNSAQQVYLRAMKQSSELAGPKHLITFPVIFELLIWGLYVCLYKYSYYLNLQNISAISDENFPYTSLVFYAVASTLYLIPLYRSIVPRLLDKKKYGWLAAATGLYLAYVSKVSFLVVAYLFLKVNPVTELASFYQDQFSMALQQIQHLSRGWNLHLLLFDFMAFGCVAFVRYAFRTEQKRVQSEQRQHQLEKDNLALQLNMLKTQLQPHFLFNTLNSMYGLSLSGSKDTPRFILLLSEMMQYILYETGKEYQTIEQEVRFLNNYFELEQRKFPAARITFDQDLASASMEIPPLLFLPLVENSFKHGSHRIKDNASVHASLTTEQDRICFKISNNTFQLATGAHKVGGIGLENLQKRLALYYPNKHYFFIEEGNASYTAELVLQL